VIPKQKQKTAFHKNFFFEDSKMQHGKISYLLLLVHHLLVQLLWTRSVDAFGLQQRRRLTPTAARSMGFCQNHKHPPSRFWVPSSKYGMVEQFRLGALSKDDDDDDNEDDEREYARVRRRGRRSQQQDREYNNDEDTRQTFQDDDDDDYDQRYQNYEEDYEWVEDLLDDDDDEDDEPVYGLFGDEIIPNELLDNIDPDGAADRFPELARDPRFWFDMFLFVAFLDFLSWVGPRDPFPDLPPL
jgi:hypothetical protein